LNVFCRPQPQHQRKEKQFLDEVIDNIKDAQDEKTMRYINPDDEEQKESQE